MPRKEMEAETVLASERLGDERRIRATLVDWGTDESAIERMLDEHRARKMKARRASDTALNYSMPKRPAPVAPNV